MKNSLINALFAGSIALGSSAMAQSNPGNPDGYNTLTPSHTLTTTINGATAKVLTGESDTPLVPSSLQSDVVLNPESLKKLEKNNTSNTAYQNLNPEQRLDSNSSVVPKSIKKLKYRNLSVGVPYNAQAIDGSSALSVGLRADASSKMKHGTLGVAARVADSATVSLTASVAREDAGIALGNKDFDGKTLEAEQIMLGLDGANVGPFKTAGISLGAGKAHATELGSTTALTTENRDVDTSTATENWRDTYSTKTTTNYSGSTWNSIGVRGVVDVGTQGELSLRGGVYINNIMGNTATGGVGYTQYMGTAGKFELGADGVGDNKVYSAKYTKPLSEGWALTAGVSHLAGVVNDTRAMVGLVWTPGANLSYIRPTAHDALDANKVVASNLSSAENNLRGLGNYGKVEKTTDPKTLTGSEKTGETKKQDTTPPIVTLNGSSTVTLTVGDTWSDPGITCNESCTTIITGNVDTNAPGTYTMFYQGKDNAGNMSSVITRTVVVKSAVCPPGTSPTGDPTQPCL